MSRPCCPGKERQQEPAPDVPGPPVSCVPEHELRVTRLSMRTRRAHAGQKMRHVSSFSAFDCDFTSRRTARPCSCLAEFAAHRFPGQLAVVGRSNTYPDAPLHSDRHYAVWRTSTFSAAKITAGNVNVALPNPRKYAPIRKARKPTDIADAAIPAQSIAALIR